MSNKEQSPGTAPPPKRMSGARAVVATLEHLGVTDVFGLPGGAIMPVFDALYDSPINQILVRHEQAAGHAAEGYALSSGKTGVAIVTSGPGATNLMTALADAHMDSVPLVAISGQVSANAIGTDAFQESDVVGVSMPITKHNFLVTDAAEIPTTLAKAFHLASTGRKGPVLVDIAKNAQNGEVDFSWPVKVDLPGYKVPSKPHTKQLKAAAKLMAQAERPILYVGGGALAAEATEELRQLVEITDFPVVLTLTAQGAFPSSDPHCLGMPGMHGSVPAVTALQRADVMVALGTRFDDRVTGRLDAFAPDAKVIHADIDPAEISKNRVADIPIVGDLRQTLQGLLPKVKEEMQRNPRDISGWKHHLDYICERYPLAYDEPDDGLLPAQYVVKRIGEMAGKDAIYCTGVGQHQMWSQQFLPHENPRGFLTSAGLGTMGVAIPEAIGAQVANPKAQVWAIDGDGCFQMTNQELAVATLEKLPIKVAIVNNSVLGMVHQWQEMFFDARFSNTLLHDGEGGRDIPDFVKLAEAYGALGLRARTKEQVDQVIAQAMETNDRPVVIDFRVSTDSQVWPMVPAGDSNSNVIYAAGQGPVWESED
ncbi:acetolactate synthase large subunit [Varibaculum prostatecancerukia]